jgi:uncharacterized membrane protein
MTKHFWQTVGLGTVAGFRSMTAPALLSANLVKFHPQGLTGSPLRYLQKPLVANGLKLLAGSEMVGDKLPQTPDRIAPPVLLGRLLSGALVGAALYRANHANTRNGALLGGLVAGVATFGSFWLRKKATRESGLPISVVGGFEDLLVLGSGLALSKGSAAGAPAGYAL